MLPLTKPNTFQSCRKEQKLDNQRRLTKDLSISTSFLHIIVAG